MHAIVKTLTTLCLVEQLLNARPLTALISDVNDFEALIPNHFLLGRSTVYFPVCSVRTNDHSHRCVFRPAQYYTELVWRRWPNELVPQLHTRTSGFLIQRYLSQLTV